MRSSPRTKGCTQEKSLCERAAAFDLVFTLRFYSTRHRGTEHPSFSAPNFSVSNSIPSGQVTLSSSTESDKEKRVQKLSRENERKHSSGKAIRPGKRFKLRFLLAILILLRYHQISKKSRFKLCQKPFAERKFEDQDQDWIENQSPQHSIQVGLSIQVVRPIIQHPRPGRCLLQIQVPLILTQLGLIDSQPIPTWDSEVADSVAESVDLAVSVAVFDDVYVSKSLQESISDLAWKIRTEEDRSTSVKTTLESWIPLKKGVKRFDGIILLKHLACHYKSYKLKALMRNNRLYELAVYSGKKMLFRFRDSLNLLPGKLSDLAKNL
ncbi:hypothetical protein S83_016030 [Arachis hypogaea]